MKVFFAKYTSGGGTDRLGAGMSGLPVRRVRTSFMCSASGVHRTINVYSCMFMTGIIDYSKARCQGIVAARSRGKGPGRINSPCAGCAVRILRGVGNRLVASGPVPVIGRNKVSRGRSTVCLFRGSSLPSRGSVCVFLTCTRRSNSLLVSNPGSGMVYGSSGVCSVGSISRRGSIARCSRFVACGSTGSGRVVPISQRHCGSVCRASGGWSLFLGCVSWE